MNAVMRPQTLAQVAIDADFDLALREFLDEAVKGDVSARISEEPALTGNDVRDAFLAAVAETLAVGAGLGVPAWAQKPERFLRDRAWFAGGLESLKSTLLVERPPAFRRRLLFVSRNALSRA